MAFSVPPWAAFSSFIMLIFLICLKINMKLKKYEEFLNVSLHIELLLEQMERLVGKAGEA